MAHDGFIMPEQMADEAQNEADRMILDERLNTTDTYWSDKVLPKRIFANHKLPKVTLADYFDTLYLGAQPSHQAVVNYYGVDADHRVRRGLITAADGAVDSVKYTFHPRTLNPTPQILNPYPSTPKFKLSTPQTLNPDESADHRL